MPRKPLTEDEKSIVREKAAVAARRIMDEHGAEKVTIRGIAKEVGMSAMSLYTYFENKADIVTYLQVQAVEELTEELSSAAAGANGPETLVATLGRSYVAFAEEKTGEFNLAFRTEEHGGKMPPVVRDGLKKALAPLHDAVSATVKEARSPEEVDRIVAGIWSGWHGYAMLKQAGCVVDQTPIFDAKTAVASFGAARASAEAAAH
jgi:AcrR family transcriptional regulator